MLAGWKQKYRKKYKDMAPSQFKKDLEEFVNFIGPFKNDNLYEGADTVKAKIQKIADTDYLRGNEADVVRALSDLPDDHGAVRILRGLKNNRKTITAVANAVLRSVKRKEKEAESESPQTPPKMAAESLLRESTIDRWQQLAGIKKRV